MMACTAMNFSVSAQYLVSAPAVEALLYTLVNGEEKEDITTDFSWGTLLANMGTTIKNGTDELKEVNDVIDVLKKSYDYEELVMTSTNQIGIGSEKLTNLNSLVELSNSLIYAAHDSLSSQYYDSSAKRNINMFSSLEQTQIQSVLDRFSEWERVKLNIDVYGFALRPENLMNIKERYDIISKAWDDLYKNYADIQKFVMGLQQTMNIRRLIGRVGFASASTVFNGANNLAF